MKILGLSAHYHDSAAALLVDGAVVSAAQEERFSRKKHDADFPAQAAAFCLRQAGITADQLDAIAYYEKPWRKFDRLLSGFFNEAPRGFSRYLQALPNWFWSRLWLRGEIEKTLDTDTPIYFLSHHESHAAAAFGPSPFEQAAVLTLDGVGEWTSNGLWRASGSEIQPLLELRYPDSLGLLYSAFTAYCGFKVNDGEYKLMGLAPYGEPRYVDAIYDTLIDLAEDGSYRLRPEMFAYRFADRMTSAAFHTVFGGPPRNGSMPLARRHADLARSIQVVTEEIVLRQARFAREQTGLADLCMAGGVALNCVANGRLAREKIFDNIWIQPAAGDAGGALGAAYGLWLRLAKPDRKPTLPDGQGGSLLGPSFDDEAIEAALNEAGRSFRKLDDEALLDETSAALADGEAIGWFQGAMEFGPRALGHRSILADPRDGAMQSRVNLMVKERESFRPFAPVVADEQLDDWFDMPARSPYMLLTGTVRNATPANNPGAHIESGKGVAPVESPVAAVTHVDGSARVQSLHRERNPRLHALLQRFGERTGCPVLMNTSFNGRDEPIVCSPADAIACFERTGLDRLVLGSYVTRAGDEKRTPPPKARPPAPPRAWLRAFAELAAAALVASLLYWGLEWRRLATVAGSIAGSLALLRVVWPSGRDYLERGFNWFAKGVSRLLGWPVLGLIWLLVFTPAGLWRRMGSGTVAKGKSYWHPPADPDHDPTRPH